LNGDFQRGGLFGVIKNEIKGKTIAFQAAFDV
jgi:hypothetical protein